MRSEEAPRPMIILGEPFYTYNFGSMSETLETALQTEFFKWFHLEETERRPETPGEVVRFRSSGPKFRDLCYLDVLRAANGRLVRMELVLQRQFIDGRDRDFAQDIVKSFLIAALPQACQAVLKDFMGEISTIRAVGVTPGHLTFQGRQSVWQTQTGWSRLVLANLSLLEGPSFVVHVKPNPTAPNAVLIA